MQTNILNDLVWNLQVPASGSNDVGENELNLQSLHEHPTSKPGSNEDSSRMQLWLLEVGSCGCKAWPQFPISYVLNLVYCLSMFLETLKGYIVQGEKGSGSRDVKWFLKDVFSLTA